MKEQAESLFGTLPHEVLAYGGGCERRGTVHRNELLDDYVKVYA